MDLVHKIKVSFFFLFIMSITSCSMLDIQPWSSEEIVDGIITTAITGDNTSYGNEATCNHYKMKCGSGYREWVKDGKIACSCRED